MASSDLLGVIMAKTFRPQTLNRVADLVDDVRLNAFGRLVQQQDLGLVSKARAMASCCCCPPLSTPPLRWSISFNTGNSSRTRSISPLAFALGQWRQSADFPPRLGWENIAALRDIAQTAPGALLRV